MIKEYKDYLKNNPHGYWFKRKLYGWGWIPATWQGWVVIFLYIIIVISAALGVDEAQSLKEIILKFILPIIISSYFLIRISYLKGEPPKWQWGEEKKDGL